MDIGTLIEYDRQLLLWLNGSHSLFLDGLFMTLTTATTWIPLYVSLFLLVVRNSDSVKKIMVIVACAGLCVLLAGTIDDELVKPMVARWRPTRDPQIGSLVDVVNGYRSGQYGFFSAHASNTFSIAVFFCWLVRSRLLSVSLVLWSLVNCWTRLYLGVHFPIDILVGLAWGGCCGTAVYMIYRRFVPQTVYGARANHPSPLTSTGYQFSDVDTVVVVLLLTVVYALLRSCLFLYAN